MTELENGSSSSSDKKSDEFNLDAILISIGDFGKYQIRNFVLIIPPMIFNSYLLYSYVFITSSLVHRCRVPECEGSTAVYQEPWTDFSIPKTSSGDLDKCYRYVPYNRSSNVCFAANFDQNSKERCGEDFIFRDNEVSISKDFDIYCSDEWKLAMAGTINVCGQFIGAPVGGYFSDRYGRRTMVAIGGFSSALLGIFRSFSINYYMFVVLGFLENMTSGIIYATLFIIGVELVSHKTRVCTSTILTMFFTVGEILLATVAKYTHNWRWILRAVYIPGLAHVTLLWFLPESVRWLLSRGEEEKATEILRKAAKTNKRKLSNETIEKLILQNRYQLENSNETHFPITKALRAFPLRIMMCSFCWFSNILIYQGLNLNSVLLAGNKYDNFRFVALVEIPALTLLYFTINRLGRRYLLCGSLLVCGTCLGASIFISKNVYVLQLLMFLVGKMGIAISFGVLYIFTSEIFPTNLRTRLLSFCVMSGKVGSMVAPQTALLAKYNKSAPAIIFSVCALVAASMALTFPETTNVPLPSTTDEAQVIGQKETVETRRKSYL